MSDALGTYQPDPEFVNQVHNSNRILRMDAKIKEVIDYLKNWEEENYPPEHVIKTAIEKLENV